LSVAIDPSLIDTQQAVAEMLQPSFIRSQVLIAWLSLVLGAAVAAQQFSRYEPEWNTPAPPHKIIGNVYFVGTTELGTFLVTTRNGHILLDPGFEESVPLIKNAMRTLGFKYEEIRVLLNSQAHFDHAAGLALIKRETGARLEAMGPDATLLEAGGKGDFLFGDRLWFPAVTVDRVLRDGDVIEQGGVRLTAHHTPGHTKGATTFTMVVTEGGRAYPVVFATSTTVNEGTSLVDNPKYPEIVTDWARTYAILESLTADVWVSAHSSVFDMKGKFARIGRGPNPYVDPKGFRRFVIDSRQRFNSLLAAQIVSH
jgi:metallo-beta-lactamase class B